MFIHLHYSIGVTIGDEELEVNFHLSSQQLLGVVVGRHHHVNDVDHQPERVLLIQEQQRDGGDAIETLTGATFIFRNGRHVYRLRKPLKDLCYRQASAKVAIIYSVKVFINKKLNLESKN